jgi:hypothetical protein
MLDAQRLIQVGSSLSADGVQPGLQAPSIPTSILNGHSLPLSMSGDSPTRSPLGPGGNRNSNFCVAVDHGPPGYNPKVRVADDLPEMSNSVPTTSFDSAQTPVLFDLLAAPSYYFALGLELEGLPNKEKKASA